MYIFLSHSSKDAAIAQKLCEIIEANNNKCFLAPRDIRSGYEYASEIINGIDQSNALLLVLSENSNNSPHVLREIERAVTKSIPIIVYKIEDVTLTKSMEYFLMTHQWLNYKKGDYSDVIDCINNLKSTVSDSPASSDSTNVSTSDIEPAASPVTKPRRRKYILPIVIALSALVIAGSILAGTFILKNSNTGTNANGETTDVADSTTASENNETTSSENTAASKPVEDDTTSGEETTTKDNNNAAAADVEIGDTIIFGRYNNADIVWKVLKINDDKTAVLISDKVLTMKGFDGADGGDAGRYNGESQSWQDSIARTDMKIRTIAWGNGDWSLSTIRTWLNSDKEYVEYPICAPTSYSFSEHKNAYNNEAGFLYNFTEEEREAIVETTVTTKGNIVSGQDTIVTKDKVFLLSLDELEWFEGSGISIYATPTPEAVIQNEDTNYKYIIQDSHHTDTIYWWLRDPVEDDSAKCHMVSLDIAPATTTDFYMVCVEGWGIRPAITVDLTSDLIKAE